MTVASRLPAGYPERIADVMRAFAAAWPAPDVIGQRFVGQLPWGHNPEGGRCGR